MLVFKKDLILKLSRPMTLNPGDLAPEFMLPDTEGNSVSLSDFRGQPVVLYFYPRDNTPGCTKEACGFRDLYAEYRSRAYCGVGREYR